MEQESDAGDISAAQPYLPFAPLMFLAAPCSPVL